MADGTKEEGFLDGLTDAERRALEQPDDDEEGGGNDEHVAPSDDVEREDGEKLNEHGDGGAAKEAAKDEEEPDEPAERIDPVFIAKAPADLEARLQEIDDAESKAVSAFDDGEITGAELKKALAEINKKRSNLEWEARQAEIAAKMDQQARENAWNANVRDFMSEGDAAVIAKSKPLLTAFDGYVQDVTSDPKNAGKSDKALLSMALANFKSEMESAGVTFYAWRKDAINAEKKQAQSQPAPRRAIPPTLAKVPQSDIADMQSGKFAALDRLKGTQKYEEAVARLSPAEWEEYANSDD